MRYWDSSALVGLLLRESVSADLLDLYQHDPEVVAWWGSEVECVSALARLERDDQLDSENMNAALARLDALAASWHEVQPLIAVRTTARRLLRVHPLRAADALQLAAAIAAAEQQPATLDFVCCDRRLTLAAQREGFRVVP